jgi:hypothetical protein
MTTNLLILVPGSEDLKPLTRNFAAGPVLFTHLHNPTAYISVNVSPHLSSPSRSPVFFFKKCLNQNSARISCLPCRGPNRCLSFTAVTWVARCRNGCLELDFEQMLLVSCRRRELFPAVCKETHSLPCVTARPPAELVRGA